MYVGCRDSENVIRFMVVCLPFLTISVSNRKWEGPRNHILNYMNEKLTKGIQIKLSDQNISMTKTL